MECVDKIIILVTICGLWFWSFLLLPKNRREGRLFLSFLALCGLVMFYSALVDPAGLL